MTQSQVFQQNEAITPSRHSLKALENLEIDLTLRSIINNNVESKKASLHNSIGLEQLTTSRNVHISTDSDAQEATNEAQNSPENDEDDYPDGGLQAYLVLLGSALGATATLGLFNSIGSVQTYLNLHQLKDVSSSVSSIIFSVFTGATYFAMIVSGVLFDEYGAKLPSIIGCICLFIGLFCAGNCSTVAELTVVLGFFGGSGVGILSNSLIGAISHWFLKYRATAFGLATLGGSVGGMMFPILCNKLFSTVGYMWGMRIIGIVCTSLVSMSVILVKERIKPERVFNDIHLTRKEKIKLAGRQLAYLSRNSIDIASLKDPKFLFCVLGTAFAEVSLSATITYLGSYVTMLGYSEKEANTMLTILNGVGIAGRYLGGVCGDRYGCYNVMLIMMFFVASSSFFLWTAWSTTSKNLVSIYTFVVVYGFFNSCVLSLSPSCLGAISETRDFGKRYATMYFLSGIVVVAGILGGGSIIGNETVSSYRNFSLFCGFLSFAGVLCFASSRYAQVGFKLLAKI